MSSAVIKGTNFSLKHAAHSTDCTDATETINRAATARRQQLQLLALAHRLSGQDEY
jgi:hypothetical protein